MSSFETTVIYKNIPDFPKYKVGDDGTVWSCHQKSGVWRELKTGGSRRYKRVCLRNSNGSSVKKVHRLVLEVFVGPCPEGMEACHNDGDSFNNNLSNLRWDTHESNTKDSIKHGVYPKGENHFRSKLTLNQVIAIREDYSLGKASYTQLARRYLVKHKTIWDVVNKNTWKHL